MASCRSLQSWLAEWTLPSKCVAFQLREMVQDVQGAGEASRSTLDKVWLELELEWDARRVAGTARSVSVELSLALARDAGNVMDALSTLGGGAAAWVVVLSAYVRAGSTSRRRR